MTHEIVCHGVLQEIVSISYKLSPPTQFNSDTGFIYIVFCTLVDKYRCFQGKGLDSYDVERTFMRAVVTAGSRD